jgi:hypothetical protein
MAVGHSRQSLSNGQVDPALGSAMMKSRESTSDLHSESPKIVCPRCNGPLTVHQPEPDYPHRFLGVCDDCKAWFFLGPRMKAARLLIAFATRKRRAGDPKA